jgi:tRNA threonylcarbamoyladenosine biosynthesis protein TsaB
VPRKWNGENSDYLGYMNNYFVLGIETSGILCSIAWWQNHQTLLEYNIERKNAHATILAELIDDGFKELNLEPQALTFVAVGSGPGSFTGLRIGMAYAKGLCYGLNIPVIPVSHFELLADQVDNNSFPIYTLIDARKGNFYAAVFNTNKTIQDENYLINITQLEKILPQSGNIIIYHENLKESFVESFYKEGSIIKGKYSAKRICALGLNKYINKDYLGIDQTEPFYLQSFAGVL